MQHSRVRKFRSLSSKIAFANYCQQNDQELDQLRISALKMSFFSHPNEKEDPSNYGDESFNDTTVKQSGLLDDLKAIGPNIGSDALTLLEKVMTTGEPYDDRTFLVSYTFIRRKRSAESLTPLDGKDHRAHRVLAPEF